MKQVEAIVAGTGVIPAYGRSLLTEDQLQEFAELFRDNRIPMMIEHDLDQPVEVVVVSAEVRDGPDGERQLAVVYEVSDDVAAEMERIRGMSISFTRRLIGPREGHPDCLIWIDAAHFSRSELIVAVERLNGAGFTPAGGALFQLSQFPPPVVVFQFIDQLPAELGWAVVTGAIFEGIKFLIRRDHKVRFRFVIQRDKDQVTAEIETSSERALSEAIQGLKDLDESNGGLFVREPSKRRWRRSGTGKRHRRRNS